jgi:subtilisin family serine protease
LPGVACVDVFHPDLAGRVQATASFVPGEEVTDINGHGTHVASGQRGRPHADAAGWFAAKSGWLTAT